MNSYHIKLNMIMVTLVIIGALNWGLTAFDYNILSILDTYIPTMGESARTGAGFGIGANLVHFPGGF
jgi:hypothetical protein